MERKFPSSCTMVLLGNLRVSPGRSQGPKNHLAQDCVQASHEATSNGIRLKGTLYFESFKMISRHHHCRSRREKLIKLDEYMFVCLWVFCLVLSLFLWKTSFQGLSTPRISTKGVSIPSQLDVICSHIILSKRNEKKSERFPEEQLAHANLRLLILILVAMTFPQLPHWPESHFLTVLSALLSGSYTCFLIWIAQRKIMSKSGCCGFCKCWTYAENVIWICNILRVYLSKPASQTFIRFISLPKSHSWMISSFYK